MKESSKEVSKKMSRKHTDSMSEFNAKMKSIFNINKHRLEEIPGSSSNSKGHSFWPTVKPDGLCSKSERKSKFGKNNEWGYCLVESTASHDERLPPIRIPDGFFNNQLN